MCRLAKEEEMQESRKRVDELEKENLELATQLAKKEAELDVKTQEKEDIEANLERTKEKLETETARHNELKHRLSESDAKIDTSSSKLPMGKNQKLISISRIFLRFSISRNFYFNTYFFLILGMNNKIPIPPPPAPPMAPPPPPGPPPPPSLFTTPSSNKPSIKKNVPQSSNPLKSFNWSKLPECKVSGTIWTDIDETRLYKALDLAEVDKLFSAYQKNGTLSMEGSIEDLRSMGTLGRRTRVISVIDSRRYVIVLLLIIPLNFIEI